MVYDFVGVVIALLTGVSMGKGEILRIRFKRFSTVN